MKKQIIASILTLSFIFLCLGAAAAAETPKEVYNRFFKALKDGKMDTWLNCRTSLAKEEFQKMSKAKQQSVFQSLQIENPISYDVENEEVKAIEAILMLKGKVKTASGGEETYFGRITLMKEDGHWKVNQFIWQPDRFK